MSNGHIADVMQHSVTQADHDRAGSGVFYLLYASPSSLPAVRLPQYWSSDRDYALAATVHMESMWSAAIGKAITKQASLGWKVSDTDDSDLRTRRAQQLLLNADAGAGWVTFLSKHLRSFLTTDNGAFIEVVRATGAVGSKILGLMHLDSHRITRTGDPERPALYRDLKGAEHILRAHQVLMFSDMPDPAESYHGVGYSAASRAWKTISKLAAIELYVSEKVTGSRATAIHLVSGISATQLEAALATGEAVKQRNGAVLYKGALVVPAMGADQTVTVATIPLTEIPDGFDAKEERANAYLIYANAIGIPVQDIQPLSGQGLGTGTQTVILDEAAEGMGLAAWRKQFEHMLNEYVLPETTTFVFSTNDIRDQKAQADVKLVRAQTRGAQITSGEITPQQALQIAVDAEDAPREFLAVDETAGGSLADDQKPVDESQQQQQQPEAEQALPDAVQTKAKKRRTFTEVAALLDEQHDDAVALYEEVRGDDE
jgi:hypothetical protein